MNSLRNKFLILIFAILLGVYLLFAIVCSRDMLNLIEQKTESDLTMITQEKAAQIDVQLYTVEHIVRRLEDYALANVNDERFRSDAAYRDETLELMRSECLELVQITDIAGAVYFTPDPAVYGSENFVYLERNQFGGYSSAPFIDLLQYDENDRSHTAWFYEPKKRQVPIWVKPYPDSETNVYTTGYVAPFKIHGEFFGVVGVNLYMDEIHRILDSVNYTDGFSVLFSEDGDILYQKDHPVGIPSFQFDGEISKYESLIADSYEDKGGIIHYTWNGDIYDMSATRLSNGMILGVMVPESTITAPRVALWRKLLIIFLAVLALLVIVVWRMAINVTRPIRELTEASTHIARGELNVPVRYKANDEIGDLAEGMRNITREMQEYVNFLHTQAYTDTMTGVGNKTAYQDLCQTLDKKIKEGLADFVIAVFDIENLKETNEKLGYEYGDRVIIDCGRILWQVFGADNLFRAGGDEFIAVVENMSDETMKERLVETEKMIYALNVGSKSYATDLVVSVGYALYSKDTDNTARDVFQRAYQEMLLGRHKRKQEKTE